MIKLSIEDLISKAWQKENDYLFNDAINYYQEALTLANDKDDKDKIIECSLALGRLYRSLSRYSESVRYYETVLNISKHDIKNNIHNLIKAYIGKGISSRFLGKYEESIKCYKEGLKLAESIEDKTNMAKCLTNLGSIYKYYQSIVKLKYT